jgi:hypothetical protein
MKRNLIVVFATLLAIVLFQTSSFKLQSHVEFAPSGGLAGDPGQANCAACHGEYSPVTRNSQFILRIAPDSAGIANDSSIITPTNNKYTPNHPNWIYLNLTGANTNFAPASADSTYYGFQFTALKAAPNDSMAGSFTLVDPAYTALQTGPYGAFPALYGPVSYVSHKNGNPGSCTHGPNTWLFVWNAPDSSTGPVTFYYSGNLGNGYPFSAQPLPSNVVSGAPGDSIFLGSVTLYPGPPSTLGIADVAGNIHALSVYPVPFSDRLNANLYLNTPSTVSITLLSIDGQAIKELYDGVTPQGHFSRSFEIGGVAAGMYFVRVQSGTDTKVIKVLKY